MAMSGERSRHSITTLRTRREWSLSEKRRIVAELAVPGAKLSWVARRNGLAAPLLYRWRKELTPDRPAPPFMPVTIAAPAPTDMETPQELVPVVPPKAAMTIEIVLPNGRAVRVGADVDTAALVRIVAALEKSE